jgi:hypothetical protein
MVTVAPGSQDRFIFGPVYAWSGVAIMWTFWVAFVVFLSEPRQLLSWWPLPTIDHAESLLHPLPAALIDLGLVALFGVQHSVMARPWFKEQIMRMPPAFERCSPASASRFFRIPGPRLLRCGLHDGSDRADHELE